MCEIKRRIVLNRIRYLISCPMKIFSRLLFLLIIQSNLNFGILEIRSNVKNQCFLDFETENGIRTCLNQDCSNFKDPLRIIESYNENGRCFIHYLKLSFTSYDLFLLFIEYQTKNNHSLGEFFSENDNEFSMLEVEIDVLYPFNPNLFLSENMLKKLGGNINILIIEIERWYVSPRSVVQLIDDDIIQKQPFQEITIIYRCVSTNSIERIRLGKYLKYQEQSTCPTQFLIRSNFDSSVNQSDWIPDQKSTSFSSNFIIKVCLNIHLFIQFFSSDV